MSYNKKSKSGIRVETRENNDIRIETKKQEQEYQENLKQLWALIVNSSKEKKEMIINQLDKETITALRTFNNPYKKPIIEGTKCRFLAFNVINMTEKYCKRLAMTSLIGFIYRMLDEYESNESKNYVSENDPKFANPYNKMVKELTVKKPEELLLKSFTETKSQIEELTKTLNTKLESEPDAKTNTKTTEIEKQLFQKVNESFIIRAKILKYRLYLLREDRDKYKSKYDDYDRQIKNLQILSKDLDTEMENISTKILLKKEYDDKKSESKAESKTENEDDNKPVNKSKDKKVVLTLLEARTENQLQIFEKMLQNKNDTKTIHEKNISEKTVELEKNKKLMDEYNEKIDELNEKYRGVKDEYNQIIEGKSTNKLSNKLHVLDNVEVDKYEPTEEELNNIADNVKKQLNIEKTAEEYNDSLRDIIGQFLDKYFRYNPDIHVRNSYKPNYDDPTRTPLKLDEEGDIIEESEERSIIPPDDTFHRWDRYIENHYEELRQATDDIYCEKSDFEFDLVPLEIFEGDTKEEAEAKFNDYKRKYGDEFESDLFCARFANHNLLSPFWQNREVRDFYNEKTEIIKRIIDQNKEDARIGQKIMKGRTKEGAQETKQFKKFKESQGKSQLEEHGAKRVSDIKTPDIINESQVPRDLEEADMKHLEVGVHVIKPKFTKKGSGTRRVRGYAENFKFNIESEELKEGQVKMQNPVEFQQSSQENENN